MLGAHELLRRDAMSATQKQGASEPDESLDSTPPMPDEDGPHDVPAVDQSAKQPDTNRQPDRKR